MQTVSELESAALGHEQVLAIRPNDSIASAAEKMSTHSVGCLLVTEAEGKIAGILTERDIIGKVVGKSLNTATTHVEQVMVRKLVACTMSTSITRAQQIMAEHGIRHLPIIEKGKPVGMISTRDILGHQLETVRALARRQSKLIRNLEEEYPGISHLTRDGTGRIII